MALSTACSQSTKLERVAGWILQWAISQRSESDEGLTYWIDPNWISPSRTDPPHTHFPVCGCSADLCSDRRGHE